jgi:NADH:ubiquinone oxidoreductase subunit 5 (subunit L)/multisubunit Na+/H+ antiporter MnhA subunit
MIFTIVILPILSALFSGILGNYVGRLGSVHITLFCMLLTTIISLFFLSQATLLSEVYYFNGGSWICTGLFLVNWGFLFDSITMSMLSMISIVSTVVHIYSGSYMSNDPHLSRFMSYLSLFTFFMFILVTSDNFVQLFLGWEGVGLCSYLLINFWYTRIQANKSALKALIINRIGDFGLLIGILLTFLFFRSINFETIFTLAPYFCHKTIIIGKYEIQIVFLITLFLFIGSVGKSAQFGLHVWLPDAMEGERKLN